MEPPAENHRPCRLIALGASNLTRILPTLIARARHDARGPVEVFTAMGHGRSYGVESRFVARSLPSIDACGLWSALERAAATPSTGIVMDVGNDLLYGFDVPTIVAWVERAIARLRPRVQRLVVAGLPVDSALRVSALQFAIVRTVLVPSCQVSRRDAIDRAIALHAELVRLAHEHGADFVAMDGAWYGIDPMHVRRRHWPALAGALLGTLTAFDPGPIRRPSTRFAKAAVRRVCGVGRHAAQPARRWTDGSTLSIY